MIENLRDVNVNAWIAGIVAFGALSLILVGAALHKRRSKGMPYPPGPKGFPLIGNVFDMPGSHEWVQAAEWGKTYGDVVFVQVMGKSIMFLNSYEAAVDLLDRRSTIYSCRPQFIMSAELGGWDWLIAQMPYGEMWKRHRPYLQKFLQPPGVSQYMGVQTMEAHKLCERLVRSPEDFIQHIRSAIGSTIMNIAYGHEVTTENDPFIKLAEDGVNAFADGVSLGKYAVEVFPILKYIPSWFPGATFKKTAKEGYKLAQAVRFLPHEVTKQKILEGTARPSLTSKMIEHNTNEEGFIVDEDIISRVTGAAYAGGADTSVSTLLTFVLAMVVHPEVQRKAQEELDRVVGTDRLPDFDDRSRLPYIDALISECLRWQPVAPLGGPHATSADDFYKGYFIPKGCWVLANQWSMLQDPSVYPNPSVFSPERFLVSEKGEGRVQRDPSKIAFGFGRRFCPGRHLAQNSIFIDIAIMLSAFNISKAIGPDGLIEPNIDYGTSIIRHPLPFKCSILPRSKGAEQLVHQAFESHI